MVPSHRVSVGGRWFVLPVFLFFLLGFSCLGCKSKEETKQEKLPPIAQVKLPPVPDAVKEKPSQEDILSSTEEKVSKDEKVSKEEKTPPAPPIQTGTVTARLLNVRSAPNLMAATVGVLPHGERVQILGEEDTWYHVKAYAGYLEGWTAKSYIEISPAEEPTASPS